MSDFCHSRIVLKPQRLEFNSPVYEIKILFNLETKNLNFSPKGPITFKNWEMKHYKNVKKSLFDWLAAKLWLKKALSRGMFVLLSK